MKNQKDKKQNNYKAVNRKMGCVAFGCLGAMILFFGGLIYITYALTIKEDYSPYKHGEPSFMDQIDLKFKSISDFFTDSDKPEGITDSEKAKQQKEYVEPKANVKEDDYSKVLAEIQQAVKNKDAKTLTQHISFNNKPITIEMAESWLKLIDQVTDVNTFVDLLEMRKTTKANNLMVSSPMKVREHNLLEIQPVRDGYRISLPTARAMFESRKATSYEFELYGKQHKIEVGNESYKTFDDAPIGITTVKATKTREDRTYEGEITFDMTKTTRKIERFNDLEISIFAADQYLFDDETVTYYINDKKVKESNEREYNDIVKVDQDVVVYAEGKIDGQNVRTNKMTITKNVATSNDKIMLGLRVNDEQLKQLKR